MCSIVLTAADSPARISAIHIANNVTAANATSALPTSFSINSGGGAIGNYTADAYYHGTSEPLVFHFQIRFLLTAVYA